MARTSQTEMAVLGGLSVRPMTGYALREEIRDVLGHFWHESFGQIYPTLAALEADGLVRREGTGRSVPYAITATGLDRLRALLSEPVSSVPPRNGLLLRLYFGRLLGPAVCRELVTAALDDARRKLDGYAAARADIETEDAADRPYWLLTVSAGEHSARAAIAWAEETLTALDGLEQR